MAVYIFVLASLIGRRQLDNGFVGDFHFPFLTFVQFFFYMGWLKVRQDDLPSRVKICPFTRWVSLIILFYLFIYLFIYLL